MAVSSYSSSSLFPNQSTSFHSLSPFSSFLLIKISSNTYRSPNLKNLCTCSYQTAEIHNKNSENPISIAPKKKKQKLKPSFYEQVRNKWSIKSNSHTRKFPWQEQDYQKEVEEEEEDNEKSIEKLVVSEPVSFSPNYHLSSPPWMNRTNLRIPQFDIKNDNSVGDKSDMGLESDIGSKSSELEEIPRKMSNFGEHCDSRDVFEENGEILVGDGSSDFCEEIGEDGGYEEEVRESPMEEDDSSVDEYSQDLASFLGLSRKSDEIRLPWESRSDLKAVDRSKWRRIKTELAEKTIPETELSRLRNVSLRMKERIKVRAEGVTQALVEKIHERWKREEVVKLRFEGPPAFNMKKTRETLERRTGGVVIWRSGSSLVLYRGMTYNLPCVQQYEKLSQSIKNDTELSSDDAEKVGLNNAAKTQASRGTRAAKSSKKPSQDLMDMDDLNNLLDELGPRFIDWTGVEPLPVDADLLPSVIPGYTPPFRVLPYRVRTSLGNKRTTTYRRLARISPPHFALGRNRELQGLAMAMVKLWERNAIAKIAIKRGVLNTNNERMAEELKKLTGGTLLSRNKEYIVFYRGNDFLSPPVTEALLEREKLVEVQQEEEEMARKKASTMFLSKAKTTKIPLVAGTLAETLEAKSRWGIEPSSVDLEKMKRDYTLSKHASLVRYLEKKLVRAQDKVNKAEKALRKVQEFLIPAEIPSDLETITDEERVLYRRMGLGMKGFLLVGRREVFDGTVENMHLHWKHRELVKIIVRGRNFLQVKHIAISLEAESGGLLVSVDKTTKGHAIVIYRGKNYQRPQTIRPKNLLTKRQALARSIELQRREALIHHIRDVRKRIDLLKSGLDEIEAGKEADEELHSRLNDAYFSEDDFDEDEGEEAYLETYEDEDEDEGTPAENSRKIWLRKKDSEDLDEQKAA